MKWLMGIGERACGVLVSLVTIPLMVVGFVIGIRGSIRYFKVKFM